MSSTMVSTVATTLVDPMRQTAASSSGAGMMSLLLARAR